MSTPLAPHCRPWPQPFQLGLLGYPLGHTASPGWFNPRLQAAGLPGSYHAWPYASVEAFWAWLGGQPQVWGFNVTVPHKQALVPYMAALTTVAQAVGAVNVVKRLPTGGWLGHNTDVDGLAASLPLLLQGKPGRVLVLGTGGAAKAAAYALMRRFPQVSLTALSRQGVPAWPPALGQVARYSDLTLADWHAADLLVQATPVGMAPHTQGSPPTPVGAFRPGQVAWELIYNPPVTAWMRQASSAGAKVLGGRPMLDGQAAANWRFWFPGVPLPRLVGG